MVSPTKTEKENYEEVLVPTLVSTIEVVKPNKYKYWFPKKSSNLAANIKQI